jgi:hypothetical protein
MQSLVSGSASGSVVREMGSAILYIGSLLARQKELAINDTLGAPVYVPTLGHVYRSFYYLGSVRVAVSYNVLLIPLVVYDFSTLTADFLADARKSLSPGKFFFFWFVLQAAVASWHFITIL